jgi:ribosome-binding protein aMBF1 (putative translation factor)
MRAVTGASEVHGPWIVAPHHGNDQAVPNLTARRQDPVLVALGDAIRRLRLAKSISQEHLALMAEVDRSYVGRIERGDNNVAILTLVRLAGALETTVATLMEQAGL